MEKKDGVGFRWGLSLPQSVLSGRNPTPKAQRFGGAVTMHPHPPLMPPAPPRLTLDVWGLPASRAHHACVLDVINLECLFD